MGGGHDGGERGKVVEHVVWLYAHELSSEGRVRCFKTSNLSKRRKKEEEEEEEVQQDDEEEDN